MLYCICIMCLIRMGTMEQDFHSYQLPRMHVICATACGARAQLWSSGLATSRKWSTKNEGPGTMGLSQISHQLCSNYSTLCPSGTLFTWGKFDPGSSTQWVTHQNLAVCTSCYIVLCSSDCLLAPGWSAVSANPVKLPQIKVLCYFLKKYTRKVINLNLDGLPQNETHLSWNISQNINPIMQDCSNVYLLQMPSTLPA